MRLHDLVNDSQPQAGASFKVGLEGFEDFLDLLRRHAHAGVNERDLPVVAQGLDGRGQRAATFHRAYRILTKIPEDLLQLVPVGEHPCLSGTKRRLISIPVFSAAMR